MTNVIFQNKKSVALIQLTSSIRKMKPLHLNYHLLSWLCICPLNERTKIRNISFTIAIMIVFVVILFASAFFCSKYIIVDLETSLYAILQMMSTSTQIYTMFAAFVLRKQIFDVFRSYQRTYDQSNSHLPVANLCKKYQEVVSQIKTRIYRNSWKQPTNVPNGW